VALNRIRHRQGQGKLSTDAEINGGSAEPPGIAKSQSADPSAKAIGETKTGELTTGEINNRRPKRQRFSGRRI